MKVTKQQKILGGVMVIGLGLVLADQFGWLPGSSTSGGAEAPAGEYAVAPAAASTSVASPAAAPVAATSVAVGPSASPLGSIAYRLRGAARSCANKPLHDAFAPGAIWVTAAPTAVQLAPADNSVADFRQAHRLTGVLSGSGRGAHAMVDGHIVAVGQAIDGFRLVAVSHRTATFESPAGSPKQQVTLTMTERAPGAIANVAP